MTLFVLTQRKTQGRNDTTRDLVLNSENINDLAIEPLRPKVVTVTGVDQLNTDSETLSYFPDAALKKSAHTKSSPNFARIHVCSAKCEAGCSGCDVETADLGKCIQNLLCYTVAEVFLISVRAEIHKRQHAKRANALFYFVLRFVPQWNSFLRSHPAFLDCDDVETN